MSTAVVLTALPTISINNIDLNGLKNDVVNILMDNLQHLLQGGASDLAKYVSKIAEDYVAILADKSLTVDQKQALTAELTAQMQLVAETNRIRAVQAEWVTIMAVTNAVLKVAATVVRFAPV